MVMLFNPLDFLPFRGDADEGGRGVSPGLLSYVLCDHTRSDFVWLGHPLLFPLKGEKIPNF